jgi:hypothetical protein
MYTNFNTSPLELQNGLDLCFQPWQLHEPCNPPHATNFTDKADRQSECFGPSSSLYKLHWAYPFFARCSGCSLNHPFQISLSNRISSFNFIEGSAEEWNLPHCYVRVWFPTEISPMILILFLNLGLDQVVRGILHSLCILGFWLLAQWGV